MISQVIWEVAMGLDEAIQILVAAYGVEPDGTVFVFPGSSEPSRINEAWAALYETAKPPQTDKHPSE